MIFYDFIVILRKTWIICYLMERKWTTHNPRVFENKICTVTLGLLTETLPFQYQYLS